MVWWDRCTGPQMRVPVCFRLISGSKLIKCRLSIGYRASEVHQHLVFQSQRNQESPPWKLSESGIQWQQYPNARSGTRQGAESCKSPLFGIQFISWLNLLYLGTLYCNRNFALYPQLDSESVYHFSDP